MALTKPGVAEMWMLSYRMLTSVIAGVAPAITELGLEIKELFLLAEVDNHPHPAQLSNACFMPRPTVTAYVKRLEAAGLLRREIDNSDLRRHRLLLTEHGRKVTTRGMSMISEAFGQRIARLDGVQQQELQRLLEELS